MGFTAAPEIACRVCGGRVGDHFTAREMMFGLRHAFTYGACASCGAVQICDPPADLSPYYPAEYYAFQPRDRAGIRMRLRRARNRLMLGRSGPLAALMKRVKPHAAVPWLDRTRTGRNARVLDVGSGIGDLLLDLHEAGFTDLTGVDPYVGAASEPAPGLRVLRRGVSELSGEYDLVMFHHSLEHMDDQIGALTAARGVLADGGWCLVRVPTVSSYAWRTYREHWIQLDPPRHFVLHSVESLRRLGERAGLVLRAVEYDSTALQFIGSEAYRRDVPLVRAWNGVSRRERRRLARRAAKLNAAGEGDQAAFYFQKLA